MVRRYIECALGVQPFFNNKPEIDSLLLHYMLELSIYPFLRVMTFSASMLFVQEASVKNTNSPVCLSMK